MSSLMFGNDNILYLVDWHIEEQRYILLPMHILQDKFPDIFFKNLTSFVELDEGVTTANIFRALKPWAVLVSAISDFDFNDFMKEIARSNIEATNQEFSHIQLYCDISFDAIPDFEGKGTRENGFYISAKPKKTNLIETEGVRWDLEGVFKKPYFDEGVDYSYMECGLDVTPIREWCNIPLIIKDTMNIYDNIPSGGNYLDSTDSILNPLSSRVTSHKNSLMQVRNLTTNINCKSAPDFINTILRGLFREIGYFGNVQETKEVQTIVYDEVENIKEQLADIEEEDNELGEPNKVVIMPGILENVTKADIKRINRIDKYTSYVAGIDKIMIKYKDK